MPGRDGTGPLGRGAATGRGFGFCNAAANIASLGFESGFGCGRGLRRNRTFFNPVAWPKVEKEFLTEQKRLLESRLNIISKKLDGLADEN